MPECDASVVTQVLDAGATVVGKANCNFCTSGGSHTCANGPVENPLKKGSQQAVLQWVWPLLLLKK